MTYPLTFYTNRFLPSWAGAVTRGPVILIRPKYKGTDEGIYQHELCHVKQWFLTLGFMPIFYLLIPEFRLWVEVQCYKKQAKYYSDDRIPRFAKAVAEKYDLNITAENVEKLMREP